MGTGLRPRHLAQLGDRLEGREPLPPEESPEVWVAGVSPGYFHTLGVPIVRGRAFTETEIHAGSPVAVVSREMARRFWGDDDPVPTVVVHSVDETFPLELLPLMWGPGSPRFEGRTMSVPAALRSSSSSSGR